MPRCFSSLRRSVSTPVSARTSAVLPWSMWPAVPATMYLMATILILLHASVPPAMRAQNSGTPTFKSGTTDARVDAQVTDGKRPLEGLTREDFLVSDNGEPQSIRYFGHQRERLSLLLLLDVSGSMQRSLQLMARQARQALALLPPGDRVAIMVFGKRAEIHQDFSDNLAESARQTSSAIDSHDVGAR